MKNQFGESALSKETVPSSKMLARNLYDAILYTAPTAFRLVQSYIRRRTSVGVAFSRW